MGDKTKIDWADATWNPVTGCLHGCQYCYARGIATRFAGFDPDENPDDWKFRRGGTIVELDGMQARRQKNGKVVPAFYPFGFTPTLHHYKLDEPQHWKRPRNIFVCSMADLFGEYVPDEWIKAVFDACEKAPQHRYLFLTKNPRRYIELADEGLLPLNENFWYGSTATTPEIEFFYWHDANTFISIEPILAPFKDLGEKECFFDWCIVGAETGNRKGKVIPEKEWITEIAEQCRSTGTPIFMKDSLKKIMGDDFRQEYPWEEDSNEDKA